MKLRSVITHPALLQAALLIAAGQAGAQTWSPPIGVPAPAFGITQTAPARPASWTASTPNYYYVDSSAGCSDSTNGFPGSARCSIPSSPGAGAYVEVHGTYTGSVDFSWTGTATAPIFIRGQSSATAPLISGDFTTASGSYVIFENLHFGVAGGRVGSVYISEGAHHIAIRDSEISGDGATSAGALGLGTWDYTGSAAISNVVVKNVNFHDIGNNNPTGQDTDAHCVTVNGTVNNLWVVDSTFARCAGDAMQVEAQNGRRDKIHHIYYGRNVAHDNKQSGGWIKHAVDVVFSQNEIYNEKPDAGSGTPGPCTGAQYRPDRIWFLFNTLHDCYMGIDIVGDDNSVGTSDGYVIGNVIYNIHNPGNASDIYNSGAIASRGMSNIWVINNTIYASDGGVYGPPGPKWLIYSNIIANTTSAEISLESAPSGTTANNNLFYRSSGSLNIVWNGSNFTTAAFSGQCAACLSGNPLFGDAANHVFSLGTASPAIDKGAAATTATPYATFQVLYGLSINYDRAGSVRPQGAGLDIGAFESGSTSAVKPTAPASLIAH